jgi:hypothetical protein
MPSPKPKPDLKQILDYLKTAKTLLPQLPVADVAKVMQASQELIEACSEEFSKGTVALQNVSDALSKQLNTIKNINPRVNTASQSSNPYDPDLMGMNQYQQRQGNPSPYTPVSPPPMQSQQGQQGQYRVDPQAPMADGQIRLEIPNIQHLDNYDGDDFPPHQLETFGEPTFTSNGNGIETPQTSMEIPNIPIEIPQAFLPTQDAPSEP